MVASMQARIDEANGEFSGDACVVLPDNYLQTADAASELYEDELTRVVANLDIDGLRQSSLRHTGMQLLLTALVWLGSAPFVVCH